jgi:hypothetical protein
MLTICTDADFETLRKSTAIFFTHHESEAQERKKRNKITSFRNRTAMMQK